MSATSGRFTAYLPRERELLRERALEEGSSENFLVRLGVRIVLGLPVSARDRRAVLEQLSAQDADRDAT